MSPMSTRPLPRSPTLAGPGPVLELGVGTGRVAVPLARRGLEVHGIDASPAMLDRLAGAPRRWSSSRVARRHGRARARRCAAVHPRVRRVQHVVQPADRRRAGAMLRARRLAARAPWPLRRRDVRARRGGLPARDRGGASRRGGAGACAPREHDGRCDAGRARPPRRGVRWQDAARDRGRCGTRRLRSSMPWPWPRASCSSSDTRAGDASRSTRTRFSTFRRGAGGNVERVPRAHAHPRSQPKTLHPMALHMKTQHR